MAAISQKMVMLVLDFTDGVAFLPAIIHLLTILHRSYISCCSENHSPVASSLIVTVPSFLVNYTPSYRSYKPCQMGYPIFICPRSRVRLPLLITPLQYQQDNV